MALDDIEPWVCVSRYLYGATFSHTQIKILFLPQPSSIKSYLCTLLSLFSTAYSVYHSKITMQNISNMENTDCTIDNNSTNTYKMPKTPKPSSWHTTLKSYALTSIRIDTTLEVELIALAFAAGINDAVEYTDNHVFASNQTGNTAVLAVGLLGLGGPTLSLANVAFSLGPFMLAAFLFGQLGNCCGRTRRAWLIGTNMAQTMLTFVAAALRFWVCVDPTSRTRWAIIGILAFASGGQVAMARSVDVPEITTAMVTSAYVDLLSDKNLFRWQNRPRNRRLGFIMALVLGTFMGSGAVLYFGAGFGILLSALTKLCVTVAMFFNKGIASEARVEEDKV